VSAEENTYTLVVVDFRPFADPARTPADSLQFLGRHLMARGAYIRGMSGDLVDRGHRPVRTVARCQFTIDAGSCDPVTALNLMKGLGYTAHTADEPEPSEGLR
jgi:hypothetical protein